MKKILTFLSPYDFEKRKLLIYKLSLQMGMCMWLVLFVSIVLLENMFFRNNINPITIPGMRFLWIAFFFSTTTISLNLITGIVLGIMSLVKGRKNFSTVFFYFLSIIVLLVSTIYMGGTR